MPDDGGAPVLLGCRGAYEALAIVKRDGGDIIAARRLVLDVSPAGGALDGGVPAWPTGAAPEGRGRYAACLQGLRASASVSGRLDAAHATLPSEWTPEWNFMPSRHGSRRAIQISSRRWGT